MIQYILKFCSIYCCLACYMFLFLFISKVKKYLYSKIREKSTIFVSKQKIDQQEILEKRIKTKIESTHNSFH